MREWELKGAGNAQLQRAQLQLGMAPIGDQVYRILEESDVFVLGRAFPDARLSGAFFRVSDNASFVVINQAKSLGHQRFTAAHELSHCLFDKELNTRLESVNEWAASKDPKEVSANAFADEFLMPAASPKFREAEAEVLRRGVTPEMVIALQHYFGVSYKAMARRLWKLNIISAQQWEAIRDIPNLRRLTLDLGYDARLLDNTPEPYATPEYVALASALYRRGELSEGRLEEILNDIGKGLTDLELTERPVDAMGDEYFDLMLEDLDGDLGEDGGHDPA